MSLPLSRKVLIIIGIVIILSIFISGCVSLPDPEVSQESRSDVIGVVTSSQSLSQTIKIRRNGFNGISIWAGPESGDSTTTFQEEQFLEIELFTHSAPTKLLYNTTARINNSILSQPINITFPPKIKSSGVIFNLLLSTKNGSIKVYGRNEDIYPYGQVSINQQPINADIAFTTTYQYDSRTFLGDLNDWLKNIYLVPSFILCLFLPGWLLLKTYEDQISFDFGQKIGFSLGISMAIIPIALLWSSTIGILWTKNLVMFFSGAMVSIWLISILRNGYFQHTISEFRILLKRFFEIRSFPIHAITRQASNRILMPVALSVIFVISIIVRLIMVRDLATPAWVDSVHHALITRIILLTGALPGSYTPYLNLTTTDYHLGFHSQLATFQLLSNLDTPSAMLIFGQVINALMVISVYTFTKSVTNSKISALIAGLVTGIFTPMPAYYTSWGRYTQLSGLLILPISYLFLKNIINPRNNKKQSIYSLLLAAITASGLFLVHYRVAAFLLLLIITEFFISLIHSHTLTSIKRNIIFLLIFSALGVLLILPWLIQAVPDTFVPNLLRPVPEGTTWFGDFSWRYLTAASGKYALVIGGLGVIWGLVRKNQFIHVLLIWIILLLIFANMKALGLPGGGLINTTSVEILLFIPISIFCGYFINELIFHWKSIIPKKIHPPLFLILLFSVTFITFIAAKNIIPILNPITILSRYADIPAINWMEENINKEKTILINPFSWGYGIYAGNDGGYWITPLTGLKTVPPPVLYGFSQKEERDRINQISQFVIENNKNAEELYSYLLSNEIQYIYSGVRGGPLSPKVLLNHSGFQPIYENQGVWIFELSRLP